MKLKTLGEMPPELRQLNSDNVLTYFWDELKQIQRTGKHPPGLNDRDLQRLRLYNLTTREYHPGCDRYAIWHVSEAAMQRAKELGLK